MVTFSVIFLELFMFEQWILVLNAGSSSLKFALVNAENGDRPFEGIAECLGTDEAYLSFKEQGSKRTLPVVGGCMDVAISMLMEALPANIDIKGIGHRVVHGGERFSKAVIIDQDVFTGIEACSSLAPLHNPANIAGIKAAQMLFPHLPQVAVFDTAFHSHLPQRAFRYAVPASLYTEYGVRKYGFHGTSHHYVGLKAAEILEKPFSDIQLITAHLGNGCSVSAIRHGHSIDTSMGMTPLAGVVMGTRSGDVDPGLIFWLANQKNMSTDEISKMLNKESGLLGLSSLSNDMRTLEKAASEGHDGATLAIEVFCFCLAKTIAAMSVSLECIDALVFTGGIGENSPFVRGKVMSQLKQLNFLCDDKKNATNGKNTLGHIEKENSQTALVIPTDEEQMIASQTFRLIGD